MSLALRTSAVWVCLLIFVGVTVTTTHAATNNNETRAVFLGQLASITLEYPKRADGSPRKILDGDWYITPEDPSTISVQTIRQALQSYLVVSDEEWTHPWAPVRGGSQGWTGLLMMKDGRRIRWMRSQEGRLALRYPDGRWLYLMPKDITRQPHQEQPWEPRVQRVPDFPIWPNTPLMQCEMNAATAKEAEQCMTVLLMSTKAEAEQLLKPSPAPAHQRDSNKEHIHDARH